MKIPSAGTPLSGTDLASGLLGGGGIPPPSASLQDFFQVPWCRLTGSGTSALFAALQVLSKHSGRKEIVLPAYTAPSLILPIRKAGLTPILCEVNLKTLNSGPEELLAHITEQTLAVMPVHMFGLPVDTQQLAKELNGSNVYILEDACSAMGAKIHGHQAGTLGDVGFHSFNRGKNLATLAGGALIARKQELVPELENVLATYPQPGLKRRTRNTLLTTALAAAVRPAGYAMLYPLVSKYKYTELHTDFETWAYTSYQARVGRSLLKRSDTIFGRRYKNGRLLHERLSGRERIELPSVPEGCEPVYNQFPLLLQNENVRTKAHRAILETGLEATLLYPDPIHRIYNDLWDGTGADPFPGATEISQRILLIPVHPLVPLVALEQATEAILKSLKQTI
ncbi:MAG: DegT/DnrJ/EryC1/StrS family aminotransferase [bacterium]|nr:DegT/DnrJ/EryC1/StrS family aminotransferase [bacterium]